MTTESGTPDVSEAQIEVHWREEDYISSPPKFVEQANANDPAILDRFAEQTLRRRRFV
jgi:acetyl-CoA synthetase